MTAPRASGLHFLTPEQERKRFGISTSCDVSVHVAFCIIFRSDKMEGIRIRLDLADFLSGIRTTPFILGT
jgi:hypothetical protein